MWRFLALPVTIETSFRFVFVSRADSARSSTSGDIPLARRSARARGLSPKKAAYIVLLILFIGLLIGILFSTVIPYTPISSNLGSTAQRSSIDEPLLGHYPYPEASPDDLVTVYPGLDVHKDTYKALRRMRSAAASDGIDLVLLSGYRSIDLQRQIFYGRKSARNQIAIERAKVSAPPGYSEHSTGYAIDLGDATSRETDLEVDFETTKAFQWLEKNAAKFHFVMSFPRGNPQKVSYEPWHWRYEGTIDALKQFQAANEPRR